MELRLASYDIIMRGVVMIEGSEEGLSVPSSIKPAQIKLKKRNFEKLQSSSSHEPIQCSYNWKIMSVRWRMTLSSHEGLYNIFE